LDEIMRWRDGLPGRGVGGGRPSNARQRYLSEALTRGLSRDEADHLLAAMGDEFPEMTEPQVCEWLLERWRGSDEMEEILKRYR
jgi:hypothetical protein